MTAELLILALPMIAATVSRMLMGFIDFVMVSQLGTAAQAAISPATLLVFALACVGMGIAHSVQTFVSQADGRGEQKRCGSYAWQAVYVALVTTALTAPVVLTVGLWFPWLARMLQHPADVTTMQVDYLRIALWSVGPATVCVGLESFFNGIRRPGITLVAVVAALVCNVIGNYLLIFGPHVFWAPGGVVLIDVQFPAWGIAGAAVATLLAWGVRAGVCMLALLTPANVRTFGTLTDIGPSAEKLRGVAWVGVPTSIQWLVDIGAWVVFLQVILPPLGETALAASNIAIQWMHLCFMPALGLGQALTSQVGFAIGEGMPDRAALRARVAWRVVAGYMSVAGLLILLGRVPLTAAFSHDPEVVALGAQIMIWVALFQISDATCIVYSFALRGAGDTRAPTVMFAISCWGFLAIGGFAMARLFPQYGVHGPWFMCMLYIVVLGVLLWWRFRSGAWRSIRLFGDEQAGHRPALPVADVIIEPAAQHSLTE